MADAPLTLMPLGGLGEIGMNCMAWRTATTTVLVDCGLMFPGEELYGVDVVIPCFDPILKNRDTLKGIVLTHGHEDHIGALPWLLPRVDAPVYGSEFTLGLVEYKLREHGLENHVDLRPVVPGDRIELGDLSFTFFEVCHSIIQGFALGIETPAGRVVHTGDFKIDRNPLDGHATDLDGIRDFSRPGVNLLLSDSTNVERDGFALTEREIKSSLREMFGQARGRILITLFSSHIQRMQEVFDLAADTGRKVGVSGKSLSKNVEMAARDGISGHPARRPSGHGRDQRPARRPGGPSGHRLPGRASLAALSRLSLGEHRFLSIHPRGPRPHVLPLHPRQRPGHHQGHQPPLPPRGRGPLRAGPGHPRLGPRPPRGAAPHAGDGPARTLRARPRGIPPPGQTRPPGR